ncbi:MAG: hypothetical protein HYV18_04240 [Gammaproteobacteria bacterium]|nr:hypothetical protein [Gammaproteobacteria bacterium]
MGTRILVAVLVLAVVAPLGAEDRPSVQMRLMGAAALDFPTVGEFRFDDRFLDDGEFHAELVRDQKYIRDLIKDRRWPGVLFDGYLVGIRASAAPKGPFGVTLLVPRPFRSSVPPGQVIRVLYPTLFNNLKLIEPAPDFFDAASAKVAVQVPEKAFMADEAQKGYTTFVLLGYTPKPKPKD